MGIEKIVLGGTRVGETGETEVARKLIEKEVLAVMQAA